jgi:glycerate 2-kinase
VVGDPLDVIASGPTAPDSSTFADALAVLSRYCLTNEVPAAVMAHLELGARGLVPETPKYLPANITNRILANNARALAAASAKAKQLGYGVLSLGAFIEGETRQVAIALSGIVRSICHDKQPIGPPACLLSGGETTVTLAAESPNCSGATRPRLGGRNQEFVLAMALQLGATELDDIVILSAGTDGEDGPTDAAGAFADASTLERVRSLGLEMKDFLNRNDAYHFFDATGDLFKPGLTGTNVMDVRVVLVARRCNDLL